VSAVVVICSQLLFTAMIRLYVEPVLRPQLHWAHGFEYGSDSQFFYQTAVEVRRCFDSEGWSACFSRTWPGGGHVLLIAALFSAFHTSTPWLIFGLNAVLAGASTLMIAALLIAIGCGRTASAVIAALLALTPLWLFVHSELLREPYVLCTFFAALLALTKLMTAEPLRDVNHVVRDGIWVCVFVVACGALVQFRPYLLLPLLVAFTVGLVIRTASALIVRRLRPIGVHAGARSAIALAAVLLFVVIPQRGDVHAYTERADLSGEAAATLRARQEHVRASREGAEARDGDGSGGSADFRNGRLSRAAALRLTAPCTVPWKRSALVPPSIDGKLQALSCNREEFQRWCDETVLGKGADRNCDMAVLDSAGAVFRHLPVAVSFGLFTPYPDMWLAGFGSGGTGLRRAGYVVDGVVAYTCLAGVVLLFAKLRPHAEVAAGLVSVLLALIIIYGLSVPTQFVVARMRLGMYVPLLALGAYGWALALRRSPAPVLRATSDQPLSILLLINTFDMGGAERVYIELARGLCGQRFRVVAACLQARSGRVADELRGSGADVVNLGAKRSSPAGLLRLVRFLRREQIDVVYTFLIHSHVVGRFAGRLAGVPVVLSSQQTMGWEGPLGRRLNRFTSRWCSAIVAVSEQVRNYLVREVGVPAGKVVTIHNAVDLTRFSHPASSIARPQILIGSVARLNPEKDHATLLKAFEVVCRGYPSARLVLAGDGPERPRLERLAEELGIHARVGFLGEVTDVASVYRQFDLYVQASHVEGFSLAILEAQASALPVVVSDVGGNAEAVLNGRTGLLVPPRDVDALASAICRLLDDPQLARSLGDQARAHVAERYSLTSMVAATVALITDLLNTSRRSNWR
jgi:glycosyltransferase involved in cell wall biosynthesis